LVLIGTVSLDADHWPIMGLTFTGKIIDMLSIANPFNYANKSEFLADRKTNVSANLGFN